MFTNIYGKCLWIFTENVLGKCLRILEVNIIVKKEKIIKITLKKHVCGLNKNYLNIKERRDEI